MSQACRSSSVRLTGDNAAMEPGTSGLNGICTKLPLRQMNAEVQLKALEFRVREAQSQEERVTALADYALTALLSGMFWQQGLDGTPLCHFIFDDSDTAALVGKRVFGACQFVDDLNDSICTQMGVVLAEHWRVLTVARVLAEGSERVSIPSRSQKFTVAEGAANC